MKVLGHIFLLSLALLAPCAFAASHPGIVQVSSTFVDEVGRSVQFDGFGFVYKSSAQLFNRCNEPIQRPDEYFVVTASHVAMGMNPVVLSNGNSLKIGNVVTFPIDDIALIPLLEPHPHLFENDSEIVAGGSVFAAHLPVLEELFVHDRLQRLFIASDDVVPFAVDPYGSSVSDDGPYDNFVMIPVAFRAGLSGGPVIEHMKRASGEIEYRLKGMILARSNYFRKGWYIDQFKILTVILNYLGCRGGIEPEYAHKIRWELLNGGLSKVIDRPAVSSGTIFTALADAYSYRPDLPFLSEREVNGRDQSGRGTRSETGSSSFNPVASGSAELQVWGQPLYGLRLNCPTGVALVFPDLTNLISVLHKTIDPFRFCRMTVLKTKWDLLIAMADATFIESEVYQLYDVTDARHVQNLGPARFSKAFNQNSSILAIDVNHPALDIHVEISESNVAPVVGFSHPSGSGFFDAAGLLSSKHYYIVPPYPYYIFDNRHQFTFRIGEKEYLVGSGRLN